MSGQKDLREVIQALELVAQELRTDDLSLDQRTAKAEQAMDLYREFKNFFADRAFDVKSLAISGDEMSEKPFDWKGLD